jgi:UDP-GlcNAc:undecaprenyl-phosphate GlcNAc-1-phosphate transferase
MGWESMNKGLLFATFAVALVITPLVRIFARRLRIVDRARGDLLKIHKKPVALLGGLAIVVAVAIGIIGPLRGGFALCRNEVIGIAVGGLMIFGIGLWDDVKKVRPIFRLLTHILAGVFVLLAGLRMNFIPIWWIIIPFTIIYVAGAINAFNVTDGMDGLCAGFSLISCIGYFFLGLKSGNALLCALSAVLFMTLLGFLPYNFHPAKIFLGDAGSGFLGFSLGTMAVMATSKPYDITNFIAAILVIGVPVFDMAFAIFRRLIKQKPLFIGDRDHLYDLLLKKGWSQPKVWGVMCSVQLVLVAIALGIVCSPLRGGFALGSMP